MLRSQLNKYRELRRLRIGDDGGEPKSRMRQVAKRWPGALREIDELPMEVLEARIAALESALGGGAIPAWAPLLTRFHGTLRACLAVKREAGRDVERARSWIARSYRAQEDEPPFATLQAMAESIARPPGGRLSRVALLYVASEAGLSIDECEARMFPPSPRRSREGRAEARGR